MERKRQCLQITEWMKYKPEKSLKMKAQDPQHYLISLTLPMVSTFPRTLNQVRGWYLRYWRIFLSSSFTTSSFPRTTVGASPQPTRPRGSGATTSSSTWGTSAPWSEARNWPPLRPELFFPDPGFRNPQKCWDHLKCFNSFAWSLISTFVLRT